MSSIPSTIVRPLHDNGIPAGPINSLDEVFADQQIIHRGMELSLEGIPSVRSPIRFSESELVLNKPSPKLGEHNSTIFPDIVK